MNIITEQWAKELVGGRGHIPSNCRFVMWPVETVSADEKPYWWAANQNDFILMVDNIRSESVPGMFGPYTRVVADFDFGRHGTHKVHLILASYMDTVCYLAATYKEAQNFPTMSHIRG